MSEEVNQPDGQLSLPAAKDFPQEASNSSAEPQAGSQQPGGGRRRRRRRKNGGRPQPGDAQNASNASGEPQQASGETQSRPPQQQQGQGQGQRRNGRRRNKRPFGSNQQNNGGNGRFAQQGQGQGSRQNGANNNNNGRRRRGRRQVVFVGPMDHSYRAQGPGNVADDLPSNQNGRYRGGENSHENGNGNGLPEHAHAGEHHIREDAPVRIFCFVEDLFFLAKIQEVARKVGVKVAFLKNDKDSLAKLFEQEEKPALIIIDLNNINAKPLQLIPKLRTKFKKGTSILGFVSHIQGDLKVKAQEEGCDVVMPRSAFSQNLPNIFHRHAEDDDDNGMQPPGI